MNRALLIRRRAATMIRGGAAIPARRAHHRGARLLHVALIVLLLLIGAAPVHAAAPVWQITQVDTTRAPQVTVYATGDALAQASLETLQVREDGRLVQVVDLAHGSGPLTVVLVIDSSASMADPGRRAAAVAAATTFLSSLHPGDRAALIAFGARPVLMQPLSDDPASIVPVLRRLRPEGGTALYDAVAVGVTLLRDTPGRRALMLIADGRDCRDDAVCPDRFGSRSSLAGVADAAARAGTPIYALGVAASPGGRGIDALRSLAEGSGGAFLGAGDSDVLEPAARRVVPSIRAETAITYHSPHAAGDNRPRDIQITLAAATVPLVEPWLAIAAALAAIGVAAGAVARRQSRDIIPLRRAAVGPTILLAPPRTFCPECGHPARPGARYCARCGAPQS